MIGKRSLYKNFEEYNEGKVTFGDGKKQIVGKRSFQVERIPKLGETLYVKGIKVILISISQICENKFNVKITNNMCMVTDQNGKCIFKGTRSYDNYYYIHTSIIMTSNLANNNLTSLWHEKLGHMNVKDLVKSSKTKIVHGLPTFSQYDIPICASCQLCKQTHSTYKKINAINTGHVLELIHIHRMGPIRIDSIRDKKYIVVVIDEFSRFT